MSDSFSGTRYDIIKSLEEDVELLLKRVGELLQSHTKCRNEVATLSQSNNEVTSLLRDMRTLVSKEAIQKLYAQLSTEATNQIWSITQQLRDEVSNDFEKRITAHTQTLGHKLGQLQNGLESLYQTVLTKDDAQQYVSRRDHDRTVAELRSLSEGLAELTEEVQNLSEGFVKREQLQTALATQAQTQAELLTQSVTPLQMSQDVHAQRLEKLETTQTTLTSEQVTQQEQIQQIHSALGQYAGQEQFQYLQTHGATKADLENLVSQEQLQLLRNEVVDQQQFAALRNTFVTKEELPPPGMAEEKLTTLTAGFVTTEQLGALLPQFDGLTGAVEMLRTQVRQQDAALHVELEQYLRRTEALKDEDVRSALNLALTKVEFNKERQRLAETFLHKDIANSQFLTRVEFDALKSILATKNDLQTLGKADIDALRAEQEMLKRSVPTRDHLNLLRVECDGIRDTCAILESKIEKVSTVAPPTVTADTPPDVTVQLEALKAQIALLESKVTTASQPVTKTFTFDDAGFKYMKVGDCRFIISNGFRLVDQDTSFALEGIELPDQLITATSGTGYSSTLDSNGRLLFRKTVLDEIEVRRFMLWY